MKFGYFDDQAREYVITTPKTPLPWINYLGNKDFFTLISNTGGGYSFYKDAKLLRLTRYRYNNTPYDNNGKYFYIKDQDLVWNPGWQPTKQELDSYECHQGLGYTSFTGTLNQIRAHVLTFVPLNDACELSQVTLTNDSDYDKELSLFSYVEWCLWNADDDMKNFQRNLSIGEVEVEDSTIYHKTEYRERRNHYALYSVNCPVDGFDTDRDAFLGFYGSPEKPAVVSCGHSANSIAHGWAPVASHHIRMKLAPGESRSFVFILAYIENPEKEKWESSNVINKKRAHELLARYQTDESVEQAFLSLKTYWNNLLSGYRIESDNAEVNRMVNIWNQYQCMITFNMSRSASYYESGIGRGMGFRDSCQDLLGFVHLIPERARERILDIASVQFGNGSTYHQYQPLTKTGNADIGGGFNDDPLWLIACTDAYIRETGDLSILSETVKFEDGGEGTLFEHLTRSFHFTISHKGPHDLPLIGRADWNDCLNLNCFSTQPGESFQTFGSGEGPVAESVFIGGMFVKYGEEYARLAELLGKKELAEDARREVKAMYNAVMDAGWDGKWFIRAYDAFGCKVGSHECEEGRIYIEPQGFCVLAGIGVKEGLAQQALDSVKEHLDTKYGVVLLQPAYTRYHEELGEISSYPPGYKENAGIFCHNNPWISIAETIIGRGERAFEIYKKTCPAYLEAISEIHRTEPYCYSQMIAGKDAATFGEAKNSWLTGTAAWTFINISQYILGIQPDYDGLLINPCIPKSFGNYKITRRFRGAVYHIEIQNPDQKEHGVNSIWVDGKQIAGNKVPYIKGKTEYHVKAIIS